MIFVKKKKGKKEKNLKKGKKMMQEKK